MSDQSPEERAAEAARKQALFEYSCVEYVMTAEFHPTFYFNEGWSAGIAYARANPGPEVLRLVEVLELLTNRVIAYAESGCIDGFHYEMDARHPKPSLSELVDLASIALDPAWRKVRGGA